MMMNFKLREYQEKAHNGLIEGFKKNLKMLLVMATGAGKSKTAISFVKKYEKHFIFIIAVRTRDLVNQLAQDLDFFELDYGVFMANHQLYNPMKEIQLCSIDTIHSRGVYPHQFATKDIILIIDEADQSKAEGYQILIEKYCERTKFAKPSYLTKKQLEYNMRNGFLFGMTATPYNGLSHFDSYIEPITPLELNAKGVLVDYKYIIPSQAIDTSEIEIRDGEYVQKQVELKLNNKKAIKECFQAWLEHGNDRQTLIFCVNQEHAREFCKYINNFYNNYEMAAYVDATTPEFERLHTYDKFRFGIHRFLINVRLITRGVNIVEIGCILDCATTLSVNLHIQKIGRGSRENELYDDCIVIDCANNLVNNGHFYQKREIDLTKEHKRSKTTLEVHMKYCHKCFRAGEPQDFKVKCPYCGHTLPKEKAPQLSEYQKNKLFLETATEEQIEQRQMIKEFKKILWKKQHLHKMGKAGARESAIRAMLQKHGVDKCKKIKKSIGLTQKMIDQYEMLYDYEPLDGLDI